MAKNTIKIKNYLNVFEEMISTAVAIKPGMLLEMTNASGAKTCQAHSTAQGNVIPLIALEDEMQGKTIDDAYAATAGTHIQVWIPQRGDIANMLVVDGTAIAVGDLLVSNGDGYLKKYVATVDSAADVETIYDRIIVGQALEAITSSSATTEDRCLVRIF